MKHLSLLASLALAAGTAAADELVLCNLTKAVRDAGLTPAVTAPTEYSGFPKGNLFDGDGATRYLANDKFTAGAGKSLVVSYALPDGFRVSEDVVVTGYKLIIGARYTDFFERLPRTWALEGSSDGTSWTKIDAQTDFFYTSKGKPGRYGTYGWNETLSASDAKPDSYSCEIRFNNSRSFRKYRFVIERLQAENMQLQLGEIELLGYVGSGIAGKVPDTFFGNPMELTKSVRAAVADGYCGSAVISSSAAPHTPQTAEISDVDFLFSGLAANKNQSTRFLTQVDGTTYPVCIRYSVPDAFVAGHDIVLSNYTIACLSRYSDGSPYSVWSSMLERMPKTWTLEGSADGNEPWVELDAHENFTGWAEEHDKGVSFVSAYRGSFDIANRKSFRHYRLKVDSVNGGNALQLSEITLSGLVGQGITGSDEPVVRPKGLKILFWGK